MPRRLLAFAAPALGILAALALLACGNQEPPQLLLFFFSHSSPDRPGLYAVSGDGTGLRQLALLGIEELASPPVPSPNGQRLAFPCRPDRDQTLPQTDLCLSAPDGSDVWVATRGKLPQSAVVGESVWAPDSRLLAFITDLMIDEQFVSTGEVYVLDADSGGLRRLIPGTAGIMRGGLQWSPSGHRLAALAANRLDPNTALEVIDLKDGAMVNVVQQIGGQGLVEHFAWSPDGSALAFIRSTWRSALPGGIQAVDLYSVAADGSNLRELPGIPDLPASPIWSPDGRWLAVSASPAEGGFARIYSVPVGGGEPFLLAPDLVQSDFPAWSPDSRRLAFQGAESAPDPNSFPPFALYVADVESRELWHVAEDLQPLPLITWSPDGRRLIFTSQGNPCVAGCPPGFLFAVPADGSVPPVQVTDFTVDEFVGWRPEER